MFDLFHNPNKNKCPVPEERRLWLESAFQWLMAEFGEEAVRQRRILRPDVADFPQPFDQTENDAYTLLPVIAEQMETDPDEIELEFYSQESINYSGGYGGIIPSNFPKSQQTASGYYHGRNIRGKYTISLEIGLFKNTEALVATLAHEIAHIKLLGEGRMEEVDEDTTDLTTVLFGLGIFNANSAYNFTRGFDGWSSNRSGYLRQQEWGYALALLSFVQGEKAPPHWVRFLTPNIQADVKQGWRFIQANPGIVFRGEL